MNATMNGFCKIENDGEIDVNAFRLLGASTKENDDTKIGFFGSGIKYAIASALREGIPLKVFSGEKEVKITTKQEKMGDMTFDVIYINGKPTSLTTRMGKDWKPWFIFREFYCNALDAGGMKLSVEAGAEGEKGKTRFYIGVVPQMKAVLDGFDGFFSEKRIPFVQIGSDKVFRARAESMSVYRKGILVFRHNQKAIYDYDFGNLDITEARTASDFDSLYAILKFWRSKATPEMVRAFIEDRESLEFATLNWSLGYGNFSEAWEKALVGKTVIPWEQSGSYIEDIAEGNAVILPHKLCVELHQQLGDKIKIRGFKQEKKEIELIEPDTRMKQFIEEAKTFIHNAGIKDLDIYPIYVGHLERNVFGQAENGRIILSPFAFEHGKREVVKTIIEEYVHCKTAASDNTRHMQESLLNMIVSAYEELQGVYL